MAIKLESLGAVTNWADGDILEAADLVETLDTIVIMQTRNI